MVSISDQPYDGDSFFYASFDEKTHDLVGILGPQSYEDLEWLSLNKNTNQLFENNSLLKLVRSGFLFSHIIKYTDNITEYLMAH